MSLYKVGLGGKATGVSWSLFKVGLGGKAEGVKLSLYKVGLRGKARGAESTPSPYDISKGKFLC